MARPINEIVTDWLDRIYHVEENEGVVDDDLLDEINGLELELAEKSDAIIRIVEDMRARGDMYTDRGNKVKAYGTSLKNASNRLKEHLAESMKRAKIQKLPTLDFPRLRLQKNPPSVEIFDECAIAKSDGYWRDLDPVLDKKLILKDLKEGKKVDGARLKQTESIRW